MDLMDVIDRLDEWVDQCAGREPYYPSSPEADGFAGFRIDEQRWREETDSAARLMICGISPSTQTASVQYWLMQRLLVARRALLPLAHLGSFPVPWPSIAQQYLVESWPGVMLGIWLPPPAVLPPKTSPPVPPV